ncbi:MAG: N-6 DNA methylase [Bacilli bacterium]|nr:N-6 DNA methylase [Bacilli bacterium]
MVDIIKNVFDNELYKENILSIVNNDIFSVCRTEEDIRKMFENETNRLLRIIGAIKEDEYINFKSEVATENGRRIDSKFKNIIIEYKKYKKLLNDRDHENAKKQLADYMNDSQFNGKSVYGILFDGYTMEIYHKDEEGSFTIPNKTLNGVISAKNLDYYFKTAFLSGKKEMSSYMLKEDFSINTPLIKNTYRLLYNSLSERSNTRTGLMLKEWEKMFRLSESDLSSNTAMHQDIIERRRVLADLTGTIIDNSEKEYIAIFSLHTLFSLILKLILCKSMNEFKDILNGDSIESLCLKSPNEIKKFFIEMENGSLLKRAGLINMLEGDFFSWYVKEQNIWCKEFIENLKKIIGSISLYENVRLKNYSYMQDLFRELYEAFIPHIIRHCFGEYYTPYWLAENVMLESSFGKDIFCSILDPCCGSGTFLISAINRRLAEIHKEEVFDKKIDFSILTKGIYGIDLNPLAVLMAKINILINIIPYITDYNEIEIPIYNGDSTYSPIIENIDGVDMLSYSLNTTLIGNYVFEILLPYEFVKSSEFIQVIDKLEEYILLKNKQKAKKFIIKEIEKNIQMSNKLKSIIGSEVDKLIELEEKELNGIWLRIFANYLKTGTLPRVDCILGNPPWVRWNVLPENYRNTVKSKCKLEGLFSSDTNYGGVDLNICALIANKCCEKWLKQDGRLSFLMPMNLLFNKSFEGFRNLEVEIDGIKSKCYFESISNWSKAGNPFGDVEELFCTYHITFSPVDYKKGIVEKFYVKNNRNKLKNNSSWKDVENNFNIIEQFLCVFTTNNNNNFTRIIDNETKNKIDLLIGMNEYNFRKGVDAQAPMRLTFKRKVNDSECEFYLWKKEGKRLKQTTKTIVLETKYIRPFITAPMIEKNKLYWESLYVICPYKSNNVPIDMDTLIKEAPKTAMYLSLNETNLSNRSAFNRRIQNNSEYYALLRMGNYSFLDFYVAIRDNSKFVSCIVGNIKSHWGEELKPIFDGHVSYISEHNKGTQEGITFDEATYINSILNLEICNYYIINSASLRSIGTRFMIKIPKFKDNERFSKFLSIYKKEGYSGKQTEKAYFALIKS